jgi:hypothetical protein
MRHVLAPSVLVLCAACGASAGGTDDPAAPGSLRNGTLPAVCVPTESAGTPTYGALFDRYFAPGTPGHCANAGCHANPGFNEWLCGDSKESCYAGMVAVGLIDTEDPLASLIGSATQSPLSWINPAGNMPFDASGPFPEGRDAVLAWVAACAPRE